MVYSRESEIKITNNLCCDASKKMSFRRFLHKFTPGSTSTCVLFLYEIPLLSHNFSHTFEPEMHHPVMDS